MNKKKTFIVEVRDELYFLLNKKTRFLSGEFCGNNESEAVKEAKDFYAYAQDTFPDNIVIGKVSLKS